MAHADFAGTMRRICLAYLPDLAVGDYVISHMGYALTKITEADATATLATMREYGVLGPADQAVREGAGRPGGPAAPAGPGSPA